MTARIAAAIAAATLAALGLAAPAGAATAPSGTITITRPASTGFSERPLALSYRGPVPTLRAQEYLSFSVLAPHTGTPVAVAECNSIGFPHGDVRHRRLLKDVIAPNESRGSDIARWCRGLWLVQFQVYTPFLSGGSRAWKPRLTLARRTFTIR